MYSALVSHAWEWNYSGLQFHLNLAFVTPCKILQDILVGHALLAEPILHSTADPFVIRSGMYVPLALDYFTRQVLRASMAHIRI